MAKYDYKGTKITGTSTTAKVFPKSDVALAKKGELYFNTAYGHVYRCDTAGKPASAKWKYLRTDIAKKPEVKIAHLGAPARITSGAQTRVMQAKWKVPGELTKEKNGARAEGLYVDWWLGIAGKDPKHVTELKNEATTESTINLENFKVGSKTYTRESFYPFSGKPKLKYVSVGVQAYNSKGNGPEVKETRYFTKPTEPKISAGSLNTSTGVVSFTVTSKAGNGYAERYDTVYKLSVYDSRTKKTTVPASTNGSTTAVTNELAYDAQGYQNLGPKDYIKITVVAYTRGYAGNSEKKAKREYYLSYPNQATINEVAVDRTSTDGKCTVRINTNSTDYHPVDVVRLGYLANVAYTKASDIPGDAAWQWTDIVDNAKCTALAMPLTELIPDRGMHSWVCVKSFHANEAVLFRYSEYREVKELFCPASTAADDPIDIISTAPGADGESIIVTLGWNKNGSDDSTGTELSWADAEDAWRSTKAPDEYSFTWSDGSLTVDGVTYNDSATVTIKGLDEGTLYWITARRYLEGDTVTYSAYATKVTQYTSQTPESIVAVCNRFVPTGSSLQVNWTFAGNGLQTEWQIVSIAGTVIADGTGSMNGTQIDADRLADFAVDGSITFTVQASTGSGYVVSDQLTVTIQDPPTLALTATSPLTAQSLNSFTAVASTQCDLIVILTSQGASGQLPEGALRQTAGDTIHSDVYSPTWTVSGNTYTATVSLPEGLDLWDGGIYTLEVTAIDRESGLRSEAQTANIEVNWSHKAPDPFDYVTLTALDYMDDENDAHHQAVQITLTAPDDSVSTDVYDIYRLTGDGPRLIGESFPLTGTATDEYAPFGADITHFYRVAIRTADGDTEFADIEYDLEGSSMRFDWQGGSLELPYNLSIGDSYKKDVDIRKHMNGSVDGYWNRGVERTGSLSSDLIRLTQQDEINAARALARYTGPVFVRTPDGSAYEADVQVSDLSTEGVLTAIAIDATEIGLTPEFALMTPYELEEEATP